jgi:transcriptional regulator with XRE-family HTH domain
MIDELVWIRRAAATGTARAIRETAGLSLSEVARELGVTPAAVSRWERGHRAPRGDTAVAYAALLKHLMGANA